MSKEATVAIVDDDESVRLAISNLIRFLGFKTVTFGSAEEFLRSSHAKDIACLVTDIHMPGMNGIDLHAHLLANNLNIPTIFITGISQERTRQKACAAGAVAFLEKPFDSDDLIECLRRVIPEET